MTNKLIEAYKYYKSLYPEALILFHLPGQYVAFGEDAERVSKLSSTPAFHDSDAASLPDDILLLSELGEHGLEIQLIECRNDDKMLDIPDVRRIMKEKEMDF